MKLRCSSILKAALALVLAVILLAGTTVTGFSAIVDELAETSTDYRRSPYFLEGDPTQWNSATIMRQSAGGYYCYYEYNRNNYDYQKTFRLSNSASVDNSELFFANDAIVMTTAHWSSNNIKNGDWLDGSNWYFFYETASSSYIKIQRENNNNASNTDMYIVVFYPKTLLNNEEKPIIAFYTYLPDDTLQVELGHGFGSSWADVDMTESGGTWSYTLTGLDQTVTRDFCIKEVYGDFTTQTYKSNTHIDITNKSVTLNTNENNCALTTTIAGSYTFTYDVTTKEVSVTFPTSYVTFNLNGHSSGTPSSQIIPVGDKATKPADPIAPGFVFQGWYTSNAFTTQWDFNDVVTADLNLVAKWSEYVTKAGQTFYFDKSAYSEGFNGTPSFQFSTDGSDSTASGWLPGLTITNRTNVYYVEAPAGYSYLRVKDQASTPLTSDWGHITNAQATTITFNNVGDKFHGPALPYTDHYGQTSFYGSNGVVYFDNTITDWDIDSTKKLYFVIGNTDDYSMIQMTKVPDTEELYYIDAFDWTNYTYFAFALATGVPSSTHANPGFTNGILNNSIACTTLVSVYDLTNGEKDKSFIGFGLDNTDHPVLDFLWISDKAIDGNGVSTTTFDDPDDLQDYKNNGNAFEGDYLNRGITLSVTGGTADISGKKLGTDYKTTMAESGSTSDTYYFVRTSTVTLSNMIPASGYAVRIKVGNEEWATPTLDTSTNTDNDYTYSFTVPGGDEHDYAPVEVKVVYSAIVTVYAGVAVTQGTVSGLAIIGSSPVNESKSLEPNFGQVTMSASRNATVPEPAVVDTTKKEKYTCSIAQSDLSAGYLTLNASYPDGALSGTQFVGWVKSDALNTILSTELTDFHPISAGTYYAVYSHPVTYRYSYTSRDNSTKYYDQLSATNATYAELSSNVVDFATRSDEITTIGNTVSGLVSVFNTTLNFNTRTGTAADGSPLTATISPQNDDIVSTKTNYDLTLYSRLTSGISGTPSPLVSVSGNYNDPIDLTAMELKNGNKVFKPEGMSIVEHAGGGDTFYCWRKLNSDGTLGDVISTQANYGFSLTGNLDIVPIFGSAAGRTAYLEATLGSDPTTTWKAFVDRNEVTKELVTSGSSDLYNDTIVRFSNITNTSQGIGSNYTEYGVVILAQTGEGKSTKSAAFEACNSSATVLNYLEALKGLSSGKKNAKMNTETYGKAYAFYIPTDTLSNLNRAEICLILDNALFSGGQYIVASYAYNPVSSEYIISDSELHTM
jgi:uncharacterized repeat protein (TIGR02543 family)